MKLNFEYEILSTSGEFVDFNGISKENKNVGYRVTLENNDSIVVSEDHIFFANNKNMYLKSLIPNVSYITTNNGDFYVKNVEKTEGGEFYDIIDSENNEYSANNFSNHNCKFVGSGNNFIDEKYLKRIQEHEVQTPIREEYVDKNMWIWEDPQPEEVYIQAVDASAGHGDDNSTINILKIHEVIEEKVITKHGRSKRVKLKLNKTEQVAEYYGKTTPNILAEIAYQYGKIYNNAYTVIDVGGGYGVQTVEKLIEYGYENIHYTEVTHRPTRDRLAGYIKRGQKTMTDGKVITIDLIPGFFIGSNRASMLIEMQRAIHLNYTIIRSIRLLDELKTFITVGGSRVADHKRTFHDDSIMGLAIALYVLNYDMAKFKQNKTQTEKMLNAMMTVNDITKKELERGERNKPIITSNNSSHISPYITNSWLFGGLDKKKK